VPYDFSETDFRISMALISTYLTKAALAQEQQQQQQQALLRQQEAAAVPWGTLRYLIGEAMYGEAHAVAATCSRRLGLPDGALERLPAQQLGCGGPDCNTSGAPLPLISQQFKTNCRGPYQAQPGPVTLHLSPLLPGPPTLHPS
jgi:hypothetical protein